MAKVDTDSSLKIRTLYSMVTRSPIVLKVQYTKFIAICLFTFLNLQGIAQDFRLYRVYSSHPNLDKNAFFIPLSQNIDPDSYKDFTPYWSVPSNPRRARHSQIKDSNAFLKSANVEKSDSAYVLHLPTKSLHRFAISQFKAAAIEDAYENGYHLGLTMTGIDSAQIHQYYSQAIAYIGRENPFNPAEVQQMVFESISGNEFPIALQSDSLDHFFKFSKEDYSYYIRDRGHRHPHSRKLVVIEKSTGKKVFDQDYFDSEGVSLTKLFTEQSKGAGHNSLYTGKILKNKPTLVTGLAYYSFGCDVLEFLDSSEPPIRIRCDNRH